MQGSQQASRQSYSDLDCGEYGGVIWDYQK